MTITKINGWWVAQRGTETVKDKDLTELVYIIAKLGWDV